MERLKDKCSRECAELNDKLQAVTDSNAKLKKERLDETAWYNSETRLGHSKDIKLATAEQENAAMAAELARVKAELKDLKEKTLLETVCSVASEVISYIPFRKKRKIC